MKLFNADIVIENGVVKFYDAKQFVVVNQHKSEVKQINARKLARLVNKGKITIK